MSSPEAPQPIVAAYRPLVRAGDFVICSGQLGVVGGSVVPGGVSAELRQALENLTALLASEGLDLTSVVKTSVFLVDMANFGEMNETYVTFFPDNRPARSAFGVVALPLGARVEVEAWAYAPHLSR